MVKRGILSEWNEVGDAGVVELAKALEERHLAELAQMYLGSNKISGVGLQALVRALSKGALPKLRKLNVNENDSDENGARLQTLLAALVRAWSQGALPTRLNLGGMQVGYARSDD